MACAVASGLSVDSLFGLSLFVHVCMRACACACVRAWKGKGTKLFFCGAPKINFGGWRALLRTCVCVCVRACACVCTWRVRVRIRPLPLPPRLFVTSR